MWRRNDNRGVNSPTAEAVKILIAQVFNFCQEKCFLFLA
nr:MAG TPA: hypothetical protein [Caudoviricetes sp.]